MAYIAVNSEEKARIVRVFQHENQDLFILERFNANHELSNIELDAINALQDIRVKTGRYLEEQETKALLEEVGTAIAINHLNNQTGAAQNTQAFDSAIGESHHQIDALQVTLGSSSLSNGPSNHSGHLEIDFHGLFPNDDEVRNGGQTSLTKHTAEKFLSPDGQWHYLHDAWRDSGIDTTGPEI